MSEYLRTEYGVACTSENVEKLQSEGCFRPFVTSLFRSLRSTEYSECWLNCIAATVIETLYYVLL